MRRTARYQTNGLPKTMLRNPLIEALDEMGTPEDTVNTLASRPADFCHDDILRMPTAMRLLDMTAFDDLYYPPEIAGSFAEMVDTQIRAGYIRRNPMLPEVMADLYCTRELMRIQRVHGATLAGMILLVGNSGMGKTRLVRSVLGRMPQAIIHTSYRGKEFNAIQITWLSVDAPIRGSLKGLMLRILAALDTAVGIAGTPAAYEPLHRNDSLDKLIGVFATAAATYHLGVLHVDDLQRISSLRSQKHDAFQFIVQLANAVKCPVIFSGTPDIQEDYAKEFEAIRRMCSCGSFRLERSKEFSERLLRAAFKFQWTDKPVEPTDEQIARLRVYTQDITSVTLLLHKEAQRLALSNGHEALSPKHYATVYHTALRPMHAALRALRRNTKDAEAKFEQKFRDGSFGSEAP